MEKMHKLYRALLVTLLALTAFGIASAAGTGVPIADTYTNINAADTAYGTETQLWATLSGNNGICTTTRITYLQWDLSNLAGTSLGSASIQLTRTGGTSNPQNYTVGLYEVGNGWTETSTWNTAPQPTTLIESKPFPTANGEKVTFNSTAFVDSLQGKLGGTASYAIQFVQPGGCSSTVSVIFGSRESGANAPALAAATPTAVEVSTASAERSSWPLYAGLGAVALVVIAGVMISRRRTA
jgi:hypothetical protein